MFFSRPIDYKSILLKYIDDDFSLFACGEDAPNKNSIIKFERKYGLKLPNDFKDFSVSKLGGLYVDVKESVWPRAKGLEVGPFWSFLYGLAVFGFAPDIPDWMDIKEQANKFQHEINPNYVPFMKIIGDADLYCFNKKGKIYQWDHELGEFKLITKSFADVLEYEIAELRSRKDKKVNSQAIS